MLHLSWHPALGSRNQSRLDISWLSVYTYACMYEVWMTHTRTHTHTHAHTNVFHFTRMFHFIRMFHTHIRVKGGGSCRVGTSFMRSVLLGGLWGTCTARPVENAIHESNDTNFRVTMCATIITINLRLVLRSNQWNIRTDLVSLVRSCNLVLWVYQRQTTRNNH